MQESSHDAELTGGVRLLIIRVHRVEGVASTAIGLIDALKVDVLYLHRVVPSLHHLHRVAGLGPWNV